MKNMILLVLLIAVAVMVWKPELATRANDQVVATIPAIEEMIGADETEVPAAAPATP